MKNIIDKEDVAAAVMDVAAVVWMIVMPVILCALLLGGCATKTRNVEVDGMFTEATAGILGIGSVDVMATPVGEESVSWKYYEDTAWLSPSTKVRSFKFQITGTNAVKQAAEIVKAACEALKEGEKAAADQKEGGDE